MEERLAQMENDIAMLKQNATLSNYDNNLNYLNIKNITDFLQVVSSIPSATPKNFFDQVKIYSSGGTFRLYVYNYIDNTWRYATLT